MEYDSWGSQLSSSSDGVPLGGFKYRYAGCFGVRWDDATGLYYMRARWYDPGLSKFLSPDPLSSRRKNRYAYCRNGPINFVDPMGLQEITGWDVIAKDSGRPDWVAGLKAKGEAAIKLVKCVNDQLFSKCKKVRVVTGGTPRYNPVTKEVELPLGEFFDNPTHLGLTLAHELTHPIYTYNAIRIDLIVNHGMNPEKAAEVALGFSEWRAREAEIDFLDALRHRCKDLVDQDEVTAELRRSLSEWAGVAKPGPDAYAAGINMPPEVVQSLGTY